MTLLEGFLLFLSLVELLLIGVLWMMIGHVYAHSRSVHAALMEAARATDKNFRLLAGHITGVAKFLVRVFGLDQTQEEVGTDPIQMDETLPPSGSWKN